MQALSAMAAHELQQQQQDSGTLWIHFCPDTLEKVEDVYDRLWQYRQEHSQDLVLGSACPLKYRQIDYDDYDWETEQFRVIVTDCIPPSLWHGLCAWALRLAGMRRLNKPLQWANLSPQKVRALADAVVGCPVKFQGRSSNGNDQGEYYFANTGGIPLRHVDTTTLQSRVAPEWGLCFCGQVLDGHGSTVGYSRTRDWVTGRVAGMAAVAHCLAKNGQN